MKANELMIFDLVRRKKDNRTMIVVEVGYDENIGAITTDDRFYGDFEDYHETQVEPIPLTPEILEKNFRVVERSSDGYNLVINSELILAFHLKATLDFWIAQPRDCPNLTYSLPLPRYVHELQHALRLCGIEKEIVL